MMFDPQKVRPPHITLLLIMSAIVLQWLLKPAQIIRSPWNWLGPILSLIGVLIMANALGHFSRKQTPVSHAQTPQNLVKLGPFRYTRNPMYVGGALIFLGIAVTIGTWPFFMCWALIGASLHFIYIPWEEKRMHELFGDEYLDYKKSTRRWF